MTLKKNVDFVKVRTNDCANRSEDMTVHHKTLPSYVIINIGRAGGRGGIFVWYCGFDIAKDTRCFLFM